MVAFGVILKVILNASESTYCAPCIYTCIVKPVQNVYSNYEVYTCAACQYYY